MPSRSLMTKKQTESHLKTLGLDVKLPRGNTRFDYELKNGQKVSVTKTADKATYGGFLYEVIQDTYRALKDFKVWRVSINTNSFGLTNHFLMSRDGEVWEAARYEKFQHGEVIPIPLYPNGEPDLTFMGFEIPKRFRPDIPPSADCIAEVWAIPEPKTPSARNPLVLGTH